MEEEELSVEVLVRRVGSGKKLDGEKNGSTKVVLLRN